MTDCLVVLRRDLPPFRGVAKDCRALDYPVCSPNRRSGLLRLAAAL